MTLLGKSQVKAAQTISDWSVRLHPACHMVPPFEETPISSFMSQVEQKTVLSESKDTPAPEPRLQGEAVAQGGVAEQTMGSFRR